MTLNLPGIDKPTEDLKLQNILGDSNPDNQSVQLSGLPPTDNVYTQENNSPNSSFPIGEIKGYNPYDKLQGEIDNGFPMANIPIVEKFFTPEPKQSYQTPSAPDWKTMFPDIRNSRKDNIDLSPNNPWLAYFPNPGSMRVASPLLLSKAMEWENQNYQNQISNIKAQQTADYNDRMLQHQNDVNDRIVEQNRTTNAYNQYKDMAELNFKKEQERNKIQTAEDKLNADQLNQNDIDDIAGIISDYDVSNSDGTINPDKVNQRANLEYRFNIALKLGSKKAVQKILEDLGKTMPKTLNQSVEGKNQATIDKTETQTDALKADQLTDDDLSNLRLNYINFQAATPEAKTVKDAIIATIDSAKPGSSAKELRKTISDIV
jgi:hypothetical protein